MGIRIDAIFGHFGRLGHCSASKSIAEGGFCTHLGHLMEFAGLWLWLWFELVFSLICGCGFVLSWGFAEL